MPLNQKERDVLLDELISERYLLIKQVSYLVVSYFNPKGRPDRIDFTRMQQLVDTLLPDILATKGKSL